MIDRESDSNELCVILAELNFDGQQTLVTPDSFAKPNILLVCKILKWFLKILELSSNSSGSFQDETKPKENDYSTDGKEQSVLQSQRAADYIGFLGHVGRLCFQWMGVRLDLVALCRADQSCCQELLKVARPIFEAAKLAVDHTESNLSESMRIKLLEQEVEADRKCCEELLKYSSQEDNLSKLSAECNQLAEELQVVLKDEETFHCERLKVIDRRLELEDIERVLSESLSGIKRETERLEKTNGELEQDLSRLDEKLAAKEIEINETRHKLSELLVKSPTYAIQYEALLKRYELVYEKYVSSYRNLAYLRRCVYWLKTPTADRNLIGGAQLVENISEGEISSSDLLACFNENTKSHRDWLKNHGSGGVESLRWWDSVSERVGSGTQLDAGRSKKSFEELATLLVFDESSPNCDPEATGRDTVGPARLLESLLTVSGTSKPKSESLGGTPAERGGLGVGAGAKVVDETELTGGSFPSGRQRLPAGAPRQLDVGLELEGLLDEFAPDELSLESEPNEDETEEDEEEDEEEEDEGDDAAADDDVNGGDDKVGRL